MNPRLLHRSVVLGLVVPGLVACAAVCSAQDSPLDRRADEIAAAVCGGLDDPDSVFDPSFLRQVPAATMTMVLARYCADTGPVSEVVFRSRTGPEYAELDFLTENGWRYPVRLGIGAEPPHLIHTLWFGQPEEQLADWDALVAALAELPGTAAFAAVELGDGDDGSRVVAAREPERVLAIGSAFKLYVLGALAAAVTEGTASWDETLRLRAELRSLPTGVTQGWPADAPVTLHTLALQMIAVSDNTATDHLIHRLGRRNVESVLGSMGMADPAANVPFLTTRELFLLKSGPEDAPRLRRWQEGDTGARRDLLAELAGEAPAVGDLALDRPRAVESAEWFASPADLVRALAHLRDLADGDETRPPLSLLGVNHGLGGLDADWDWIGFKGGSESGVLCLAWLLRNAEGRWYALALVWNDPEAPVEEARLLALAPAAARLLGGP